MSDLSKKSVEEVLDEIDSGGVKGVPKTRRSTKHCLVTRGRHYPPKYVLHQAFKLQGVRPPKGLRGGDRTNLHLKELGYTIEEYCSFPNNCNFRP
jgi:hypothetical protein